MCRRILLVEDDPNTRSAMTSLLSMEGFKVDACENGRTALQRLRERDYESLVTDLALPELNGHDLVHHARSLQPAIRCVVVSALEPPAQLNGEADAWLQKPIDFDTLVQTLAR